MVAIGGDVTEARRCHRQLRTVSEYPHAVGAIGEKNFCDCGSRASKKSPCLSKEEGDCGVKR